MTRNRCGSGCPSRYPTTPPRSITGGRCSCAGSTSSTPSGSSTDPRLDHAQATQPGRRGPMDLDHPGGVHTVAPGQTHRTRPPAPVAKASGPWAAHPGTRTGWLSPGPRDRRASRQTAERHSRRPRTAQGATKSAQGSHPARRQDRIEVKQQAEGAGSWLASRRLGCCRLVDCVALKSLVVGQHVSLELLGCRKHHRIRQS